MTWDCSNTKGSFYSIKMEFQKFINFLDTFSDDKDLPRFVTKKLIEIYDQSEKKKYNVHSEVRIKIPKLKSDLCDFSAAYIVLKRIIVVAETNNVKRNKNVAFKNNAQFTNCIFKISCLQIDNAEELDPVMPMYNLLEYSKNHKTVELLLRWAKRSSVF